MLKLFVTALSLGVATFPVSAGWLSTRPPEVIVNQAVSVQLGAATEIPVDFSERSTYRLDLALDPKGDFHTPEGKKIQWGGKFGFNVHIKSGQQNLFTYSATKVLDHSLGYGYGMLRVPADIPYGTHTLRIEVTEIDEDFNNIYSRVRVIVSKLPYLRFLD